jgi:hypothetical protein
MKIYLLDMENIPNPTGINKLTHEDMAILFYADNTPAMKMDLLKTMMDTEARIICKHVHTGTRNALDFQLSSYLGYLIQQYPDATYIIISKDTGYDVVRKFWAQEKNIKIKRQGSFNPKG